MQDHQISPYHLSSIFSNDDEEFEATKGISQNTDLEKLVNQDELEKMLDYVFTRVQHFRSKKKACVSLASLVSFLFDVR